MKVETAKSRQITSEDFGQEYGRLICLDAEGNENGLLAISKDSIVLGRDPSCDIRFKQREVSRIHAKIFVKAAGGLVLVQRLGREPVLVNGLVVEDTAELSNGDVVEVQLEGRCKGFRFERNDETMLLSQTSALGAIACRKPLQDATNIGKDGQSTGPMNGSKPKRLGEAKLSESSAKNPEPTSADPDERKTSSCYCKVPPKAPPAPAPPPKTRPPTAVNGDKSKRSDVQGNMPALKSGPPALVPPKDLLEAIQNLRKNKAGAKPLKSCATTDSVSEPSKEAGGNSRALIPSADELAKARAGLRKVRKSTGHPDEPLPGGTPPKTKAGEHNTKRKSVRFQLPKSFPGPCSPEGLVQDVPVAFPQARDNLSAHNSPAVDLAGCSTQDFSRWAGGSSFAQEPSREQSPVGLNPKKSALVSSPEGIAIDATSALPVPEQTAVVRVDADSTLDFSAWAMGATMGSAQALPSLQPAMKVWDDPYTEQLPCLEVQDEDGDTEVLPLEEFPVATLEGCPTENVTLDSVEAIRYPDMASEKLPQSQTASHAQHLQARQGKSTEKPTEYGTKSPADVSLRIALPVDREETAVLRKQLGKAKRNMRIYYTKMKLAEANLRRISCQNVLLKRKLARKKTHMERQQHDQCLFAGRHQANEEVATPHTTQAVVTTNSAGTPGVLQRDTDPATRRSGGRSYPVSLVSGYAATPTLAQQSSSSKVDLPEGRCESAGSKGLNARTSASPVLQSSTQRNHRAKPESLLHSILSSSVSRNLNERTQVPLQPMTCKSDTSVKSSGSKKMAISLPSLPEGLLCSGSDQLRPSTAAKESSHPAAASPIGDDTVGIFQWFMGGQPLALDLTRVREVRDDCKSAQEQALPPTLRIEAVPTDTPGIGGPSHSIDDPPRDRWKNQARPVSQSLRIPQAEVQLQHSLFCDSLDPIQEEREDSQGEEEALPASTACLTQDSIQAISIEPSLKRADSAGGYNKSLREARDSLAIPAEQTADTKEELQDVGCPSASPVWKAQTDALLFSEDKLGLAGTGCPKTMADSVASRKDVLNANTGSKDQDDSEDQATTCGEVAAEEGDDQDDACYICADGGRLLVCELCERLAHPMCVGLKRTPKGDWFCAECKPKTTVLKAKGAAAKQKPTEPGLDEGTTTRILRKRGCGPTEVSASESRVKRPRRAKATRGLDNAAQTQARPPVKTRTSKVECKKQSEHGLSNSTAEGPVTLRSSHKKVGKPRKENQPEDPPQPTKNQARDTLKASPPRRRRGEYLNKQLTITASAGEELDPCK